MSTLVHEDSHLERFVNILEQEHRCHTIILYGSRARGLHSPNSDYDLLGIRRDGDDTRDARLVDGVFLDAFIKSEKTIAEGAHAFLHIRDGIVLRDPDGMGARLLSDVAMALESPPPDVSPAEIEARRTWCTKMLGRIRGASADDIEAHYRRHWLLVDLLEFYFVLRRRHYLGSKESFRWLAENDAMAYRAFAAALVPGADVAEIERVVGVVVGGTEAR
jgi:predicted nucleotidyltransferase